MRLYTSASSPFAAKARIVAHLCKAPVEEILVDTSAEPDELLAANPLGKIPALVTDEGEAVFDSRVICEYLDRRHEAGLIPAEPDAWQRDCVLEATADGIADALILAVYEERYRPEEKRHAPWVAKQERKAERSLAFLASRLDDLPPALTIGQIALASHLSWMDFRFPGRIAGGHPRLQGWYEEFGRAHSWFEQLKARKA